MQEPQMPTQYIEMITVCAGSGRPGIFAVEICLN